MKNFRLPFKIIFGAAVLMITAFLMPHLALAATVASTQMFGGDTGANFASTSGLANVDLVLLIANIIRIVLGFIGVIAVCIIIYAGFLWTTAGGEEKKITKAKDILKNGVIGLVIILSSFAIAQFVISRVTTAMGATSGSQTPCTGPNCFCTGSGCDPQDTTTYFFLQPLDVACAATVQNYQPRFVFSQPVRVADIIEGHMIHIQKDGVDVLGTFSAIGEILSSSQVFVFSPATECDDNPGFFCFLAGENYDVTVSSSLRSSAGYTIQSTEAIHPLTFSFTVGSVVDTEAPTVSMRLPPSDGSSVLVGRDEPIQAEADDDVGVSTLNFWVDNRVVYAAALSDRTGSWDTVAELYKYYFDGFWNTTGLVTNHEYTITAEGSDCAGNSSSGSVDVIMRAANCYNEEQDDTTPYFETGTCVDPEPCDCGGENVISEYYCGACNGAACYDNNGCRSGSCVSGVCVNTIKIDRVSPGDGAVGNLITIRGSGFGTTSGTVTFLGVSGGQPKVVSSNSACNIWWGNNQVVVQVPVGATSGSIKITNSSGLYDQTNDENGAVISDFVVNTTVRPGICSLTSATHTGGDSVTVAGNNFGSARGTVSPSELFFGIYKATSYSAWNSSGASFVATSPLLNSGIYNVQFFSGAVGSRQGSNPVEFRVQTSTSNAPPVIAEVDSGLLRCANNSTTVCATDSECGSSTCTLDVGPVGQYVTIYGSNFGSSPGMVRFKNRATQYVGSGDNHFPEVCEAVYWSDDTIVIKVPSVYDQSELEGGLHPIVAEGLHDLWVTNSVGSSPVASFLVTAGEASPGICALVPDAGPPGTAVEIYGEGFEDDPGTPVVGLVEFFDQKRISPTALDWNDGSILGTASQSLSVPTGSQTGPVFIVDKDAQISNSLNFQVGVCNQDFTCRPNQECCSSGACASTGSCGGTPYAAHYAYYFSTGDIPQNPQVVIVCSPPTASPRIVSPSPYDGYRGGNDVCPSAALHVTFTEDMNTSTFKDGYDFETGGTILVKECTNADCSTFNKVDMAVDSTSDRSFSWVPAAVNGWTPGKRYQVTIVGGEAGVKSSPDNLGMLQSYTWYFETSASGAPCSVGGVLVDPAEFTAESLYLTGDIGVVNYSAAPISDEYECTVLACDTNSYAWAFTSNDSVKAGVRARIFDVDSVLAGVQDSECDAQALPYQETTPNVPVHINADLSYIGGHASNYGALTINFADPRIDNYWPNCSEACLNAGLGLTFNLPMKSDTFNELDYPSGNARVRLYECADEVCAPNELSAPLSISTSYDPDLQKLTIIRHDILNPNKSYRVVVSGQAESVSGSRLSNAVSDLVYENGDLSWVFTTSDLTCAVDRIQVEPNAATLNRIGALQRFEAVPFGVSDACSITGQRLIAMDFDWENWLAEDVNDLVPAANVAYLPEIAIASPEDMPVGCSSSCLNIGSSGPVAVCGDSHIGPGEDCDGTAGCSSRCLNVGTTSSTCGNGRVDFGEDCDFGTTTVHPGCSASCLSLGSSSVNATCGDGNRDYNNQYGGEDCDFGSANAANNCSSNCLNLGSEPRAGFVALCGDGILGDGSVDYGSSKGEDCDDGNTINGDGCSSRCLHEGSSSSYVSPGSPSSCLDTTIGTGEECFDGNIINGDGCSSRCLLEGSNINYATPSICGDGVLGDGDLNDNSTEGEECEATPTSASHIAPFILAYISNNAQLEVAAQPINAQGTHSASSSITATEIVSQEKGAGTLTLECACTDDASCGDASLVGCGNSNCCFDRPTIVDSYPVIPTNVCLNTAIWVKFGQANGTSSAMDIEAIKNANTLYLKLTSLNGATVTATNCPSSYTTLTLAENQNSSLLARVWYWFRDNILQIFGAQAGDFLACVTPVTFSLSENDSRISLGLSEALLANSGYSLYIGGITTNSTGGEVDGVVSTNGVSLHDSRTISFTTSSEICAIDYVEVTDSGKINPDVYEDPSPWYFSVTGEEHALSASAYALNGAVASQIQSIAGVYEWNWTWGSTDATVVGVVEDTSTDTAVTDLPTAKATAMSANGTIQAVATANISGSTTTAPVSGQANLTAFLCSHPWPTLANADGRYRYEETTTNFAFSYCLDQTDSTELLPVLDIIPVTSATSSILKEVLFSVHGTSDAIGVRVLSNPDYLTPAAWFATQGFIGSPAETTLDGYEAVRVGNTYYVSATNLSVSGTARTIYPNIYVISYNDGASDEAEKIIGQILESWTFNSNDSVVTDINVCQDFVSSTSFTSVDFEDTTDNRVECSSDSACQGVEKYDGSFSSNLSFCNTDNICQDRIPYTSLAADYVYESDGNLVSCDQDNDCDSVSASAFCFAEKTKLTRDLRRLTDAREIASIISGYGEVNSYCSVTADQSCTEDEDCPGNETCTPHVPQLLSGTFLSSFTASTWPSWVSEFDNALGITLPTDPINEFVGCATTADQNYCWDSVTGQFSCHEGSHAYLYQSIGGLTYKLAVQLEGGDSIGTWSSSLDNDSADNATLYAEYAYDIAPTGFSTTGPMCSGVAMGTGSSRCGDGVKSTNPVEVCEIGEYKSQGCDSNSDGTNDGVQNIGCEAITVGSTSVCGWDTTPSSACVPFSCGNGVVDGTDECDDGSENGTYGHCSQSCHLADAFYCGDGSIAGGEECDCANTAVKSAAGAWSSLHCSVNGSYLPNGQYSSNYNASCAYDCSFPGPSCGDREVNGSEACDGNVESWSGKLCGGNSAYEGETCLSDSDCGGVSGSCGDGGYVDSIACGIEKVCEGGTKAGLECENSSNCPSGVCSDFAYQLTRTRTCQSACTWSIDDWTDCMGGDQVCGNGVLEGDEECDDGNEDGTDDCTPECKLNVCGDDYVYTGRETCDNSRENGQVCTSDYNDTCTYCNVSCQYTTVSGAYCGNATLQEGEFCDAANTPMYCYEGNTDPAQRDYKVGDDCSDKNDPDNYCVRKYGSSYTCENVGFCNGGNKSRGTLLPYFYNAEPCLAELGSCGTNSVNSSGEDTGDAGTCVLPVCANDCGSTCPETYQNSSILIQTEEAGASKQTSADLYSYGNILDSHPETAMLFVPACEIGTAITADIDTSNWEQPTTDIVFVTDLSKSMESASSPVYPDSITVGIEVLSQAIEDLLSETVGVQIALVSFVGSEGNAASSTTSPVCITSGDNSALALAYTDSDFTISQSDLLFASNGGVEAYDDRLALGTPTAAGLLCAHDLFEHSSADNQIVILLSDGEPNVTTADGHAGSELAELAAYDAWLATQSLIADGIEVYSAALPASNADSVVGYMKHFSSDTCGYDPDVIGTCGVTGASCSISCSDYCSDNTELTCSQDEDCYTGIDGVCQWEHVNVTRTTCNENNPCPSYTYPFEGIDEMGVEQGDCVYEEQPSVFCLSQTCSGSASMLLADPDDCTEGADGEYAYSALSASGFEAMFDTIVQSVLGVRVGLTTNVNGVTTVTPGRLEDGIGIVLPFPEGFACNGTSDTEIPLRLMFSGTGTVNISNIGLSYCPAR